MLSELRRKPLITIGARELRVARVVMAAMAVLTTAEGLVIVMVRGLPDFEGRTSFGLWLVLLGSAMGLYAWRGRWTPPETEEEKARDARLTRYMNIAFSGAELLFLSLALMGLLFPSVLGGLWDEHRSSVTLLFSLVLLDVAVRFVRRYGSVKPAEKVE
ncbi:MAG: hypothetical protein WC700_03460 [Gemmatimonadaceae bacterium]|jgi:hypothetical protein